MKLNDYFDHIVVINLDRRNDRLKKIDTQLKGLEAPYERFSAIDGLRLGLDPVKAIRNSHIAVLEAYDGKLLVLEDDALFCEDFNNRFTQDISSLPEDWEMMSLGGHFVDKQEELWALNPFSTGLQGYCIKESIRDKVINELRDQDGHIDVNIRQLGLKRYVNTSNLIAQYDDYSDNRRRYANDFKKPYKTSGD